MGNTPGGERRHKSGENYHIPGRMEGQAFNIDRHRPNSIVAQHSAEEQETQKGQKTPTETKEVESHPTRLKATGGNDTEKLLPCVIKWTEGGKEVFLAGTFNNWQHIPMNKSERDFVAIVDLPGGKHEYKFLVDGEWKLNPNEEACQNDLGTSNNVVTVTDSDFEELEDALLKDPNDKREKHYTGHSKIHRLSSSSIDSFSQIIPDPPPENSKGPPMLPPHLKDVILNKDTPVSCEPTLLPEPNHVMLNHMYALSIRDGMMVLSTTSRFRKKFVTTLIYRPI